MKNYDGEQTAYTLGSYMEEQNYIAFTTVPDDYRRREYLLMEQKDNDYLFFSVQDFDWSDEPFVKTNFKFKLQNITNQPFMIPLKAGRENQSVQYETLHITPVNLFVQTKPWNDRSPHIQLELNVMNDNRKYATFLGYNEFGNAPSTNYPKAFEDYVFSLDVKNDCVHLVVEKLDFGKVFFLELVGQKAVIGNFSIFFESSMSDWSVDPSGKKLENREYFNILVSDDSEQKKLSFGALYAKERELILTWKDYQIVVLDAGEKTLKLKVLKTMQE
jgi:hypothetical protein